MYKRKIDPKDSLEALEAVTLYLSKNRGSLGEEVYKALESLANYLYRQKK